MNSEMVRSSMPHDVLFIGGEHGCDRQRAQAMMRLSYNVTHVNPLHCLPDERVTQFINWKLGPEIFFSRVETWLERTLKGRRFALCWIDQGEFLSRTALDILKKHCEKLVYYFVDDPLGSGQRRFRKVTSWLSVPDLVVVPRRLNVPEAEAYAPGKVMFHFRTADEVAHRRVDNVPASLNRLESALIFVGTFMDDRDEQISGITRAGMPVTIFGERWHKAKNRELVRKHLAGRGLYGNDYAAAIQTAAGSLCLLSRENRDEHTTRSAEVPLIGGVLVAPRTPEHLDMYEDGREALFWSDGEECAALMRELLKNPERRKRIAEAGHQRVLISGYTNEKMLARVAERLGLD